MPYTPGKKNLNIYLSTTTKSLEEILALIHNYANSLTTTCQKVGSVNLGVGKAAVGALCLLSIVLALGDRAVVTEAPLAALDLVLQ